MRSDPLERQDKQGPPPPLVLLHGLGVDRRMWSLQEPSLQKAGPLWVPDLPGFGREPPLTRGEREPGVYARWVAEGIADRFTGPVDLCGYSMGGTLSLLVALRYPERVHRLALCCTSACWGRAGRRWVAEGFAAGGRWAARAFSLSIRYGFARHGAGRSARGQVADMVARADPETFLDLYRSLAALDLGPRLGEVRAPALVVAGGRDWLAPPGHGRRLADGLPCARLALFPRGDHLLCLAEASRFGRLLGTFFRRHRRQPWK